MIKPKILSNEGLRLRTLKALGVLDTPPDEQFDRITRIAKHLFNVPISIISLVDADRQWFKSVLGIGSSETSRDVSFCGHAIHSDEVLIVPNALKDMRFFDNPLVVFEPRIRFYAGCPIRTSKKTRLGTLCIIDQLPREFDGQAVRLLKDLAASVEREIEMLEAVTFDEVTGLMNQRGLANVIHHESIRRNDAVILPWVLRFSISNLRELNLEFGYAEGDCALKELAENLTTVFPEAEAIAHISGNEFIVVISQTEDVSAQIKKLEELNKKSGTNRFYKYTLQFDFLETRFLDTSESIFNAMDRVGFNMDRMKCG